MTFKKIKLRLERFDSLHFKSIRDKWFSFPVHSRLMVVNLFPGPPPSLISLELIPGPGTSIRWDQWWCNEDQWVANDIQVPGHNTRRTPHTSRYQYYPSHPLTLSGQEVWARSLEEMEDGDRGGVQENIIKYDNVNSRMLMKILLNQIYS